MKFGIRGLHKNLFVKYNFGACWPITTPTLYKTQIWLYQISQKVTSY